MLMIDLFKAIHAMPLNTLLMIASTVKLEDYRKVKVEIPKLLPHEAISATTCVGFVVQELKNPKRNAKVVDLLFDNNEGYAPHIRKVMEPPNAPLRRYVDSVIDTYHAESIYQLQACDLVGWLIQRYHSGRTLGEWNQYTPALHLLAPLAHHVFNEKSLKTVFDENGRFRENFHVQNSSLGASPQFIEKWHKMFMGTDLGLLDSGDSD